MPTNEEIQAGWNALAPAWERHRDLLFETSRAVSERILDRARISPGDTVLEIAAGPGETSFLASERVGDGGRVVCSDFSPEMVAAARRGAAQRGLGNVECVVLDAQRLDLADATVDAAISRFGLMLIPEPARAFAECRRVLRPGGRFAYAVWGPPERNDWLLSTAHVLVELGLAEPSDPTQPGRPFSLSTPKANETLLEDAGFAGVAIEEIDAPSRFPSFDEFYRMQTEVSGLSMLIDTLDPAQAQAVFDATKARLEPYRSGEGYEFRPHAVVAHATAP